jgi:hypothetical protein
MKVWSLIFTRRRMLVRSQPRDSLAAGQLPGLIVVAITVVTIVTVIAFVTSVVAIVVVIIAGTPIIVGTIPLLLLRTQPIALAHPLHHRIDAQLCHQANPISMISSPALRQFPLFSTTAHCDGIVVVIIRDSDCPITNFEGALAAPSVARSASAPTAAAVCVVGAQLVVQPQPVLQRGDGGGRMAERGHATLPARGAAGERGQPGGHHRFEAAEIGAHRGLPAILVLLSHVAR